MTKKYKVTWKEYIKLIDKLACVIKNSEYFETLECVYGIPRGGLPIATILSYKLDLPLVMELELDYSVVIMQNENSILVVDDILESGDTIYPFQGRCEFVTAVMFNKNGVCGTKFEGKQINPKQWIVMPYDPPVDTVSTKNEEFYEELRKRNRDMTILKSK